MVNNINALNILFLLRAVCCYPTDKVSLKPDLKDEVRYLNGTVVGKYTYTDIEGNPIHVKYYANDNSYGVELKSLKVVEGTSEDAPWQLKSNFDLEKPLESSFDITKEYMDLNNHLNRSKHKNNVNKENGKSDNKMLTNTKSNLEYEVLYQNKIPKYGHENIKVYLDKKKRLSRNLINKKKPMCRDRH